MTILLKQIFAFVKLLNSETGAVAIAAGLTVGMILGFSPGFSLQTVLIVLLLFFFRIQIGAAFLSAAFFKVFAYLLDPIFDGVGRVVLEIAGLHGVFAYLYDLPVIPWTRFNNSVVMGSGAVALVLSPFIFVLSLKLIRAYREKIVMKFQGSRFWKAVQATSFYKWYVTYDKFLGGA